MDKLDEFKKMWEANHHPTAHAEMVKASDIEMLISLAEQGRGEHVPRPLNLELCEDEVTDLISNRDKVVTFCYSRENLMKHVNDHGLLIQVINHGSINSEDN